MYLSILSATRWRSINSLLLFEDIWFRRELFCTPKCVIGIIMNFYDIFSVIFDISIMTLLFGESELESLALIASNLSWISFWDSPASLNNGQSNSTFYTVNRCQRNNNPFEALKWSDCGRVGLKRMTICLTRPTLSEDPTWCTLSHLLDPCFQQLQRPSTRWEE